MVLSYLGRLKENVFFLDNSGERRHHLPSHLVISQVSLHRLVGSPPLAKKLESCMSQFRSRQLDWCITKGDLLLPCWLSSLSELLDILTDQGSTKFALHCSTLSLVKCISFLDSKFPLMKSFSKENSLSRTSRLKKKEKDGARVQESICSHQIYWNPLLNDSPSSMDSLHP